MQIKEVIADIFRREGISKKVDFKRWCGTEGTVKLWTEVERRAPEHWARIRSPVANGWWFLQSIVEGYQLYDAVEAIKWLSPQTQQQGTTTQVVGTDAVVEQPLPFAEQPLPVANMDVLVARMNAVAARENAVAAREAYVESALVDIATKRDALKEQKKALVALLQK